MSITVLQRRRTTLAAGGAFAIYYERMEQKIKPREARAYPVSAHPQVG